MDSTMASCLAAEFLGTAVLAFGGCGAAIFSAKVLVDVDGSTINMGIGFLCVASGFASNGYGERSPDG
ncbi:hypothetical protein V5R04_14720 [Jonesiaceae bacterium BS-20]|uniref:Aquaporin n=1 Tax=Jonesiaceae bacterium BS-20 TaxID=3120821 RepID=A0AAU7DUU1_9MICO